MVLRIVILGAPGSGKGTQAKRISEKYDIRHISTGDIFRSHVQRSTDLGKKITESMTNGRLVPDEVTCEVVWRRLRESDCEVGYILDGFPRTLPQAHHLQEWLVRHDEQLDVALELEVPDAEILERTGARRSCATCGKIFNLKYDPPGSVPYCERADCPSSLIQRADDVEETLRERLRIYHSMFEPIHALYKRLDLLKTVEGAGLAPDDVFAKIDEVLLGIGAARSA